MGILEDITDEFVKGLFIGISTDPINELGNYKDRFDVLHIRDIDHEWQELHLVSGEWVEKFDSKTKPF